MSEPVGCEWRFYIDDMISLAEKVAADTNGLDPQAFVVGGMAGHRQRHAVEHRRLGCSGPVARAANGQRSAG